MDKQDKRDAHPSGVHPFYYIQVLSVTETVTDKFQNVTVFKKI